MAHGLAAGHMLLVILLLCIGTSAAWAEEKPYVVYDNDTKTLTFLYGEKETLGDYEYELNEGDQEPKWYTHQGDIQTVVFDQSFSKARPTTCYKWFFYCANLKSIEGITNLNTQDVTDMSYMFCICHALTSLDLSNFNTENVTSMNRMFSGCRALTYLNLSNFNTGNVTDMQRMFSYCTALTSLDLSNFNTGKVTDMSYMFYECTSLESLNLSGCTTKKVTSMTNLFGFCKALTSLDLSGFNTENVYYMDAIFRDCSALTSLDLSSFNTKNTVFMRNMFQNCLALKYINLSSFNTEKVEYMNTMFYACQSLESLNLSNFNTENVKDMAFMFTNCLSLTSLDLSSFNTAKVTNFHYMFKMDDDNKLQNIYVSDLFTALNSTGSTDMFKGCTYLPYYNQNETDKTHANLNAGGYFKTYYKTGSEQHDIDAADELTVDNLALADGEDFVARAPFTAQKASYHRTIKAGTEWATLCLPFEVQLAGQNFRAYQLLSVNDEAVELKEIETSIAAGSPAIIRMSEGATSLDFSEENAAIAKEASTSTATESGNCQLVGLYTKKMFSEDDNNCYILKGNKLMNPAKILQSTSTKAVGSLPFRAYLQENTSTTNAARALSIGGETTAIDRLNTATTEGKAEYYDLQGHRLNDLQRGVNIIKRGNKTTKVIIR